VTKTLLVADDALIIREMIKDIAIQAGWEIVGEAENGKEAVEKFEELHPDAVTLDVVMPEFDGIYAVRHIMEKHPDARIVMVSAVDQKSVLTDAFELGVSDFLVKPFDQKVLVKTLECLAT